jgi:hypothetical protein
MTLLVSYKLGLNEADTLKFSSVPIHYSTKQSIYTQREEHSYLESDKVNFIQSRCPWNILSSRSGACTIKHYEPVMNSKWTDFVVSQCLILSVTSSLDLTNTLAHHQIRTCNVFIVQAPG